MRISTILLLGSAMFVANANACINSIGTDQEGKRFSPGFEYVGDELKSNLVRDRAKSYWRQEASNIISKARAKPDFQNLTNLAVVLIYQGKYDAAISHLLSVEKIYPGHHETAANIGTALELAGNDQAALKWIRIGVRRNRNEHYGTEWLHARILESKIALANDPAYLSNRSVAGLQFKDVPIPPMPDHMPVGNYGKAVKPYELNNALSYQLHERMQFVKPKDPVVANLLMDWATLNLVGGPVENADVLYDLAVSYGAARTPLMVKRKQEIRRILANVRKTTHEVLGCDICAPLSH